MRLFVHLFDKVANITKALGPKTMEKSNESGHGLQNSESSQIVTCWTAEEFVEAKQPMMDIHRDFDVYADDEIENVAHESTIYEVQGCVVKMTSDYILLYCPLQGIWKVLVKKSLFRSCPFIQEGHKLGLGVWMSVSAVLRHKQPYDIDVPPKYSHFAISQPKFFDIHASIPEWDQRFMDGVYQVRVALNPDDGNSIEQVVDDDGSEYYLGHSKFGVTVVIPKHRLETLTLDPTSSEIYFWANRGRRMFNYCTHLFEEEPIEEVMADGSVRRHESSLRHEEEFPTFVANTDTYELNLPQTPSTSGEIFAEPNGVFPRVNTQSFLSSLLMLTRDTAIRGYEEAGLMEEFEPIMEQLGRHDIPDIHVDLPDDTHDVYTDPGSPEF